MFLSLLGQLLIVYIMELKVCTYDQIRDLMPKKTKEHRKSSLF